MRKRLAKKRTQPEKHCVFSRVLFMNERVQINNALSLLWQIRKRWQQRHII